ncbi:TPA: colicin release lysis protein [Klebsiella pneumoniae]|nr:colicin release lysis protein [Klebsiella pneumoniae]
MNLRCCLCLLKKSFPISICVIILLAACQANYIRDVKGGTVG